MTNDNKMRPPFLALLSAASISLPCPAAAEEMPDCAKDTLGCDWGGMRSTLFRNGVVLSLGYKIDLLRNLDGGIRKGGRPMRHLDIGLDADFEKLAGWPGTSGYLNLIHDAGDRLNTHHVGGVLGVSNIEVATNTYRFLHAWAQQEFADGRGTMLVGLYPIDSEFQVVESAGVFVQPAYGASADIALTRGPSIFNTPAFGMRARWTLPDDRAYLMGAILDGIPGDPKKPRGTHISFDKGDGTMSIAEFGLKPNESRQTESGETAGFEAADDRIEKYAGGLWRYSLRVPDQVDANPDGSPVDRLSWGWYVLAEKALYRRNRGGDLTGFVRLSATDGDSTAIRRTANIGIQLTAPFAGRSDDVFGLAYTRAALSGKWRLAQAAAGTGTSAAEEAWEMTYRIQANEWLALQPVLQHIRHPGGDASRKAATIAGARLEIDL